jgi:hypothetical protein
MWAVIAAVTLSVMPPLTPPGNPLPPQAPYVSCIDGHLVLSYDQCPPPVKHHADDPDVRGGGGRGGLLGLGIGGIL